MKKGPEGPFVLLSHWTITVVTDPFGVPLLVLLPVRARCRESLRVTQRASGLHGFES